jgi:pimeloyl-ACP methyl ester carboxylesterase
MSRPPGGRQLVDIGDRVVCARVQGQGPTVVLEAGGSGEGTTGAYGEGLEERLATHATVLTYDRAGSGRSDGPPHRRVTAMAEDLDEVIRLMGCAAPVVVVGWSSGGLVAEMFAVQHPDKVAGLVLVDPSEMPTESRFRQAFLLGLGAVQLRTFALASQLGFFRTRAGRSVVRRMAPADISKEGLDWLYRAWNHPQAAWQSAASLPRLGRHLRETAAALRTPQLPDIPVLVVVPRLRTGYPPAYAEHVEAAHRALVERFPRGELVFADRASHLLPIDRPDVVITAVLDVLEEDA